MSTKRIWFIFALSLVSIGLGLWSDFYSGLPAFDIIVLLVSLREIIAVIAAKQRTEDWKKAVEACKSLKKHLEKDDWRDIYEALTLAERHHSGLHSQVGYKLREAIKAVERIGGL